MRELVFGARLNTLRRGKEGGGTSILNMFASSFLNIKMILLHLRTILDEPKV